jgi:transposase-like protein
MLRIKDSIEFVQTHSVIIVTGSPEGCPWCSHKVLHRHAKYSRFLYMQDQRVQVVVQRFICTSCKRTTSLLPDFVGTHQQLSWPVQEQVYVARETGLSAEQTAMSVAQPAGPISIRTVQRLRKKWTALLVEMQTFFWQAVLLIQATVDLPVGSDKPQNLYGWMNRVWQSIRSKTSTTGLFDFLHRLRRSSTSIIKSCTSHTTCLS